MKIKELCKEERPREMLAEKGARALSNSQLLAILLGSGTRKANVLEVANRLLAHCGGDLRALSRTGADRMQETEGIGAARYATLAAALELGRRCWSGNGGTAAPAIHGAADTYALMAPLLRGLGHEECWIILLNRRNRPVFKGMVSQGDTGETTFPLGQILRHAVERGASALVLVHNHPSGDPFPSRADIERTAALRGAVHAVGILLLDHVIVCDGGYFSFAEEKSFPAGSS